ncbi:MAG: hypothetical protein HXY51_08335 [Nitrospirae bacterium]|nr:hypothetical protein [Nitrospirota bacterium]
MSPRRLKGWAYHVLVVALPTQSDFPRSAQAIHFQKYLIPAAEVADTNQLLQVAFAIATEGLEDKASNIPV